ncbi:MAG: hypothetical protein Q9168_006389 [Polycauliona sp. 1 TL-2023]
MQENMKRQRPYTCPKGPVEVQSRIKSGIKEDVRDAIDQATKSLNRSLQSLHLDNIRLGEFNLGGLQFPSAGGCQACHGSRESALMMMAKKIDRLDRLAGIKDNRCEAFLSGDGVPGQDEQVEIADYLCGQVATETELGQHLHRDLFFFTRPMLLLSRPESSKERGKGKENTGESVEGLVKETER